jgi:pimeloyl-ACP methyl ester carboxylesterase
MDAASSARTLDLAGGAIRYHEAGEGPPLLMLHGSGPGVSGWANFGGIFATFAERFRVIVPDLPGYGATPARAGATPADTVGAVIEMMDALDTKQADIIGNSFGGMLGASMAARNADRVRRLVCIGGIGVYTLTAFPSEGLLRLSEFVEEPTRERLIAWLRSMVFNEALVTEELIESRLALATRPEIMATSRQVYSRAAMNALGAMVRGPNAAQAFAHLPSIKAPTLLAWGRDDRVNPLDGAMIPMRMIPNCELHVFPNCGHWSMIEQKDAFESVVMAFLTRADA